MKYVLPAVLLALALAGCGPKKEAHYAPIVSAVEIPVFDDDETNKVMAMYATHHNNALVTLDLLNKGNIEESGMKMRKSYEEDTSTSLFPRLIDIVKTLKNKPSEFAKFQEYMRKTEEEHDALMNKVAEKYPEAVAQGDALIKAVLGE